MPDPITGIMAGTAIIGGGLQANAASKAGKAQVAAADAGAAEQRAAREEMRKLLDPYVKVGEPALQQMMAAIGLEGPDAQRMFVQGQQESPMFQGLVQQGEDAILQNASATGGLRGGNTQAALAQFRPNMLNQFIEQQYGRLGGMAQMGQNSAAGVGSAGMTSASNIAELMGQAGAARAGAALGVGNAWGNAVGTLGGFAASPTGMSAIRKAF